MASAPWMSADREWWWQALVAWTTEAVAGAGLGPVVEVTSFRERSWGAIATVATPRGRLFFKATDPERAYEVPITLVLAERRLSLAPDLIAVDVPRGWMLMHDHGAAMDEVLPPARQIDAIASLLPAYARMQGDTVAMLDGWMAVGLPDRRIERLPQLFDEFVDRCADPELVAMCGPTAERITDACAELASIATVPAAALDHADVHGTNVLFDGREARLADWGDACVTHPFASPFVPEVFVIAQLPASERAAARTRLRDIYLDNWDGPTTQKRRAFELAMVIAPIVRILSLAAEAGADSGGEIRELLERLR